jgi:DNA polymerase III subunit alpha
LFKLDDGSAAVEATADEALINTSRHVLKDDALVIATVRVQPDRFSGGHRLNVVALWDLPAARCRFGKFLRVAVQASEPDVATVLKRHPALRSATEHGDLLHGLPVRMRVARVGYSAEIALADEWRFYPTDAALADWRMQAHAGDAQVVYADTAAERPGL